MAAAIVAAFAMMAAHPCNEWFDSNIRNPFRSHLVRMLESKNP